ncbi:MAG: glycosyltransferase family 4 protein [bacterium]|nr:glycosyltransferase family 4 protein [bacterium]
MRPHIAINATMLSAEEVTGLGVYTLNLLRELLPLLAADATVKTIHLLGDSQRLRLLLGDLLEKPQIAIVHVPTTHPVGRLIALNRYVNGLSDGEKTVFYSPTHHGVVLGQTAQIVTIHDLFARLFPQNYRFQSYYFRWYLPRLLDRTEVIVTDSDSTSADIARFYGKGRTVETVPLALPRDLAAATPRSVDGLQAEKFFLFVGPGYSYKNCDRLIDAFVQYRGRLPGSEMRLVFAGGRKPYREFLRGHILKHAGEFSGDVRFTGYVSDGELAWLYKHACAAMVTSLYEGFGLPALEAMHFGCPVVSSNTGSLPEVCGEAALFADPYEVGEIAGAMHRITEEEGLAAGLVEKGRVNLRRFRWDLTATKVCEILTRV